MACELGEQLPSCSCFYLSWRITEEELWIAFDGFREVRLYPFLN